LADEILCSKCSALNPQGTRFCAKCGSAIENSDKDIGDPLIGSFVGERFLVKEKLGEGGMGVVYKAEQTAMDRMVALKVLHSHITDEDMYARFRNEAAASSKLNHPNTITVYDFGKTDTGSLYIAMEFVKGVSLDDEIVDNGPMDWRRACHIGKQICGSLQNAHDNGIVHRDLKPENVMLCERAGERDVVKVLDFGIAKILEDDGGQDQRKALTKTGMVFGTPQYMSPEQVRGEKVDARSDIYSTGIILYQALVGQLPFKSETPMGVLTKHLLDTPPAFDEIAPETKIPAELEKIVMQTLAKGRDDRPQSMKQLATMLDAALEGKGIAGAASASPKTVKAKPILNVEADSTAKSAKGGKGLVVVSIVAVVLLIGAGAAGWYFMAGPAAAKKPTKVASNTRVAQLPAAVVAPATPPVPVAATPPTQQQPGVASQTPSKDALPALPAKPEKPTGKKKTEKKGGGSKKTKDKQPENIKVPDNIKIPDRISGQIKEKVRIPKRKDATCSVVRNRDLIGSAIGKKLQQVQMAVKACNGKSDSSAETSFSFDVPPNSNKVGDLRPVKISHMNHCLGKVFKGLRFSAKDSSPRKGKVYFKVKRDDGLVSECKIKVSATKIRGN